MATRRRIFVILLMILFFSPAASAVEGEAWNFRGVQSSDTQEYTDRIYKYSLRFPASWKPYSRETKWSEPPARLNLITPDKGTIVVSVYRLPRVVVASSQFERIAHDHVDSIVNSYLESFNIPMILGSQKRDYSDERSMRFWQGTSSVIGVLVSLHAVRYGSDVMVNVVYISGDKPNQGDEYRAVEAVMSSLSFAHR